MLHHYLMVKVGCSRSAGFSLLELLLALALCAILAAVSVPVYQHHIVLARRHLAEGCLQDLTATIELSAQDAGAYTALAIAPLVSRCDRRPGLVGHYHFSFHLNGQGQHYQLLAIPQGAQSIADAACGVVWLDDTGVRGIGGGQAVAACW